MNFYKPGELNIQCPLFKSAVSLNNCTNEFDFKFAKDQLENVLQLRALCRNSVLIAQGRLRVDFTLLSVIHYYQL